MKPRILVVDDDRTLQKLLCEFLEDEGYEVEVVDDGLKAWEKLIIQRKSYSLLLLDGVMRHMGGLELLQVLRWQKEIIAPPVIVLSASDDILQKAKYMNVDFLPKPFDVEKVLVLITRILHQQERESFRVGVNPFCNCSCSD